MWFSRLVRLAPYFLSALSALALPVTGRAQSAWPSQPVTMVVPFPAGGITDTVARLLAKELSASWKQPVVVDNKAGASGVIGTAAVARAPKDGHTVLFTITSHVQLPALQPKLPYNAVKDFIPVSQVALSTSILAVSPSFPASSVRELVAKLKAEPGKHAYGSYGAGTTSNIYGELFKKVAGVSMTHVPYKGAAPVVNDLLAGTVNIAFIDAGTAMPHLKAGKLRPLAVIGTRRSTLMPDVPTFAESGLAGFEPYGWMGVLMPAGTPSERASQMAAEVKKIVGQPEIDRRLREYNLEPVASTPAEFSAVLDNDANTWRRVIELGGVKME